MSEQPEPVIRVAHGLTPGGTMRAERHAYRPLTGHLALAMCTHVSLTEQLGDDNADVPMCPLCKVFLMAAQLDVTQLGTDPEWRGL